MPLADGGTPGGPETGPAFEAIAESIADGVVTVDRAGTVVYANEALAALTGRDRSSLVGAPLTRTVPDRLADDWAAAFGCGRDTGEPASGRAAVELAIERADGEELPVEVTVGAFEHEGDRHVTGVVRDGRRERPRELAAAEELRTYERGLRRLYDVMADTDGQERIDELLALGCDRLDLPYGFLTEIGSGTQRVVAAAGDHPELQAGGEAPLSESYCRRTVEHDDLVVMADAVDVLGEDDPAVERFDLGCYVGGKLVVDGELYGTLCFAGDASAELAFDDADRTFVRLMVEWLARELEREAYEADLEATRDRLQRMVERVDDGFFAVDEDWRVTFLNEAAETMLRGATDRTLPDSLVGHEMWSLVPETVGTQFYYEYRAAVHTGEPTTFQEYYEPLDAWFEVNAYPDDDGLSVFFRDVTDQRRREEMLTGVLERTREMMTAERREEIAAAAVDAAEGLLGVEHGVVRLYDPDSDALVPAAVADRTAETVPERPAYGDVDVPARRAFDAGEPVVADDLSGLDAGPVVAARYLPLGEHGVLSLATTDPAGLGTLERQGGELLAANATAALDRADRQQQLLQYEAVMENTEGMVFVADADDRFTMATEPLVERVGATREGLVGEPVESVVAPDGVDAHADSAAALLSGYADGQTYETSWLDADGEPFPVRVETSVLPGRDAGGYVGVVQDISALAATRTELASLSNRFGYLFENIPDPVTEVEFVDGEPLVRAVNPAFEAVFGYDFETIEGENIDGYIVPEGERGEADELNEQAATDDVLTREVRRSTADGLRTFLFRGIAYEVDGSTRGFGIYTDITDQKERQRRLQVLHTVLRHNLRTEMTLVAGYADMLREQLGETPEPLADIDARVAEVAALSAKVQRIERTVERTDQWERGPTDVVEHVRAAAERVRAERAVDLSIDAPPSATAVADGRLEVLVAELLENAVDHVDREPPSVQVSVDVPGERVELRVADDGPGIPEHERALVTGERDITQLEHGAGLGLWLVAWLTSAYGGELAFEDREPRGSVVVVRLPAAE